MDLVLNIPQAKHYTRKYKAESYHFLSFLAGGGDAFDLRPKLWPLLGSDITSQVLFFTPEHGYLELAVLPQSTLLSEPQHNPLSLTL